jgi:hypothetical protein
VRSDREQEDRAKVKGEGTAVEAYGRALQSVGAVPQRMWHLALVETAGESVSL